MQGLRSSVDRVVSQREQYISKFCRHLDRDIAELGKEVKDIKNEAQVTQSISTTIIIHMIFLESINTGWRSRRGKSQTTPSRIAW